MTDLELHDEGLQYCVVTYGAINAFATSGAFTKPIAGIEIIGVFFGISNTFEPDIDIKLHCVQQLTYSIAYIGVPSTLASLVRSMVAFPTVQTHLGLPVTGGQTASWAAA